MILRLVLMIAGLTMMSFGQVPPIEPGVSQELAKWRAANYSDVRYKLNLTLEKMSPVLRGTIEIRVRVNGEAAGSEPGAVATGSSVPIILDWRKIRGHEDKSTISNVVINGTTVSLPSSDAGEGARAPFEEHNEHLIFRDGVKPGENIIKLDFTSPILTSGSAITRYIDKEDGSEYLYSLFVPSDASTAFPVFDQPDLKARFTLDLRFANGWNVVSNTAIRTVSKGWCDVDKPCFDGAEFHETRPISTYVFAFAAGPWERVSVPGAVATGAVSPGASNAPVTTVPGTDGRGGPETTIYVRKSQAAKFKPHAAEVFRLNREAVKYFETYFDYKFPFPKYDLVLIPEFPFGGMEHAGATFLREASIIFPQEPTKNDYINRATLIFHEAAHQWFGDTVTMRWFDDLWLKEGFATFTAYKAMEKIMPEYNAWKVFYERVKQAAYQTDSTKGTTPIYQEIKNLSAAKSAYGAIVYNKAPAFLRQAEFYLGEDKFQTAVRAFLKKHEFGNAGWEDLVKEFEKASNRNQQEWATQWVTQRGLPKYRSRLTAGPQSYAIDLDGGDALSGGSVWKQRTMGRLFDTFMSAPQEWSLDLEPVDGAMRATKGPGAVQSHGILELRYFFPNDRDYGYGIFLLDPKSRDYVLKNIQNEKDDFLRTMMWGSLWDSVREAEMDPRDYVDLVIRNIKGEADESTIQTLLGRVSTAMRYYLSEPPALAGGQKLASAQEKSERTAPASAKRQDKSANWPPANAGGSDMQARVESLLIDRMQNAPTPGQKITYYRAFLALGESENARRIMKEILAAAMRRPASTGSVPPVVTGGSPGGRTKSPPVTTGGTDPASSPGASTTKDKFDIVQRLIILGDPDGMKLLAELERTETSDDAKRYAYAAKAGLATPENKAKYWNDFVNNKDISESWIEAAFGPFNNIRHSDLTLPYLERALKELPNHKRSRKIFFVNGWLGAFIGGQRSERALAIVNKFLADKPDLDRDLRLKILENVDVIERAVKIRAKFGA